VKTLPATAEILAIKKQKSYHQNPCE